MSYHYGVPPPHYTKFYSSTSPYDSGEYVQYVPAYETTPIKRHSRKSGSAEALTKGGWYSPAGASPPKFNYESPRTQPTASTTSESRGKTPSTDTYLYFGQDQKYEERLKRPRTRASTTNKPTPLKTDRSTDTPPRQATEKDAALAKIPQNYSIKNWDPTEKPILLLGSVFDDILLGKSIYDWTVWNHETLSPMSDTMGDFWAQLRKLAGKMKGAEESVKSVPNQDNPRRGRGKRKNKGYWADSTLTEDDDLFDGRECLFSDRKGRVTVPAMANLDTGLKVPGGLIMSSHYAKELGRYEDISQDFEDPCLRSISGHLTPVSGILRDVIFRLKGTSITFRRDFFICDAIDGMVDIMLGASFIQSQFKLLFENVKKFANTFATWFPSKKESKKEKAERERRELDARIRKNQVEIKRLQDEQQTLMASQQQQQAGT